MTRGTRGSSGPLCLTPKGTISLARALSALLQTFGGKDVYPRLEEKTARPLYFLVKNHNFVDGYKRVAAALFLWFMGKKGLLYGHDGVKQIANATLLALTLTMSESNSEQKDILSRLAANLIHDRSG